jgi:hypothetical protein
MEPSKVVQICLPRFASTSCGTWIPGILNQRHATALRTKNQQEATLCVCVELIRSGFGVENVGLRVPFGFPLRCSF